MVVREHILTHSVSPQLCQHSQKDWPLPRRVSGSPVSVCVSVAAALNPCRVCESGEFLRWIVPVVQAKVILTIREIIFLSPQLST